uniref:Succinyl-diaminopimelate desuccinylase n=1 Tax=Candidatus Methanophagaceae archaeon ANME-1 ERB6 TaxID=2759912 RepID=A0A7G9Z0T7_9EURY|nr:succinyl-diaminopimelate desuccinylase [Methanosarcinales archaeon ANME-1 ERB6]
MKVPSLVHVTIIKMKGKEELEKLVESKEKELIDYLTELVRIPTFVPPGQNYEKIVDWLIPVFEDFGFECEKVEMPEDVYEARQKSAELSGERMNLLATKDFGAEESVDIYTHLDVVPAGEGWSTPPFESVLKDGRIYGRGVADSKGSVASLLTALSVMRKLNLESKYNLRIALTTDEEIGPYSGLCFFADAGLLQGDYLLCMDGDNEGVCVATNGVLNWEMKVYGKSCHSSVPFLGVNAIEQAMLVIEELDALKRKVGNRQSKAPCSSYMTETTGQKHITSVFNVTMINGGVKENVIPPSCTLRGDRRYIPEEDVGKVIKEFEDFLQQVKTKHGIDLELICKPGYPPMFSNPSSEWVRRVKDAASDVFGHKDITGVQGGLDVAYAVLKTKQPVCAFGVGNWIESNAHGADENVRIRDLKDYVRFLVRLVC